jgi:Flp pilus assembly pilin Flp
MELAKRLYKEDRAAEVTELGIVLALIVALAIIIIQAIGTKVSTAYQSVNNALP